MKRIPILLLSVVMISGLSACGRSSANTMVTEKSTVSKDDVSPEAPGNTATASTKVTITENTNLYELLDTLEITGKIGIVSSSVAQSEETYRTAVRMQEHFGTDKIIIDTFPASAISEQEITISKAMAMAADPDIKVIIFNQADVGTIATITKIKESRNDILTIACNPNEDYDEVGMVADIVLTKDQTGLAEQFAGTAVEIGAKNFVHYSFPRHMSNQNVANRCALMREICESNGINFFEVTAPDPQGDAGTAGTQQFILEDVPRKIKELGEDTVFFATNIAMHEAIIKCVMDGRGMFIGQSDPSPFDAFPAALGIEVPEDKIGDSEFILAAIQEKVDEAGMNGRIATWTTSCNMMYTEAGTLYALLYAGGYVNGGGGNDTLTELIASYRSVAGDDARVGFWTNTNGHTYDHIFSVLGSEHLF